jgi:hypothetical protein
VARRGRYFIDHVDQLALFDGGWLGEWKIDSSAISGRALSLAVPRGDMTTAQRAAIDAARMRAKAFDIDLIVTDF